MNQTDRQSPTALQGVTAGTRVLDIRETRDTIAFVAPRFGDGVIGGAEAVLAEAAFGLASRGFDVEVLTTCARDHFTWANEFPAGRSAVNGVNVIRFPTVIGDSGDRDRVGNAILAGQKVSIEDQQLWINGSLRCPEM